MGQTTQIDRAEWADFAVTFSNGNKGRVARIEMLGSELGAQTLMRDIPLFALDYDPEGKGNNIVLSMGKEAPDQTHTIDGPVEIWRQQDDNGVVASLEIVDDAGTRTILTFSG